MISDRQAPVALSPCLGPPLGSLWVALATRLSSHDVKLCLLPQASSLTRLSETKAHTVRALFHHHQEIVVELVQPSFS